MVKLKHFNIGDKISTKKWKTPFIVEVIYKGYVVATIRKSTYNTVFLFIKTFSNQVYFGSSKFSKYGVNTKTSIKKYIDELILGNYTLDPSNCVPVELLLEESAFITRERREQVTYGQ